MFIPPSFARDLDLVYSGSKTIDNLIGDHNKYIRGLARHALRYKTQWMASLDEDDIYQEACYWLVDSIWRWDESKNVTLSRYVVYNIGARIQMYVLSKKVKARHPEAGAKQICIDDKSNGDRSYMVSHTRMSPSELEQSCDCHKMVDLAKKQLSVEASKLIAAILAGTSGRFSEAVDQLLNDVEIVHLHGKNRDHICYILRKTLPEVRAFLSKQYNLSRTAE